MNSGDRGRKQGPQNIFFRPGDFIFEIVNLHFLHVEHRDRAKVYFILNILTRKYYSNFFYFLLLLLEKQKEKKQKIIRKSLDFYSPLYTREE